MIHTFICVINYELSKHARLHHEAQAEEKEFRAAIEFNSHLLDRLQDTQQSISL